MNADIRPFSTADQAAVESLYRAAFPTENLVPLVRRLHAAPGTVIGLVAEVAGRVAGHAALTVCRTSGDGAAVALLGPLAVDPALQRQGIGSGLIAAGVDALRARGIGRVCVLGDPAYYGRVGFAPERAIAPPYALPAPWRDAWQSAAIGETGAEIAGTLEVPAAWQDPALWSA